MKNCTGCKHAVWERTSSGRLHPGGHGTCAFPVRIAVLPNAYYWIGRGAPMPSGGIINRKREHTDHCPYYASTSATGTVLKTVRAAATTGDSL